MIKKPALVYTIIALLALSQSACASALDPIRRAYTVDDLLKIEGVGAVQFSSDEMSIILEYQAPYDEREQYGVERGGQILQLSLLGERQSTPLFEHQEGEKYWLGNTSPDGRKILVFQSSRQQTRIGVFDFETKHLTTIDENPQVNERFEMNNPVWVNDHEIILSSSSKDWSQYGIRTRPYVVDRAGALREKAFAGESSVASVSTRPANHWYDGDLIRYNVNTKRVSLLARGRFGSFTLSADGTKLAALRLGQRRLHFPVDHLTDYFRFDTQLYVFDLEDNSAQSFLPEMNVSMGSLRWSYTGSKLSFFAWERMTVISEGVHYVMDSQSIMPIQIDGFQTSWINLGGYEPLKKPVAAEWLQEKLIVHGVLNVPLHEQGIERPSSVNSSTSEQSKWYAIEIETMAVETAINGDKQQHEVYQLNDGRLLLQADQTFFVVSQSAAPVPLTIESRGAIQILNGGRGDKIENMIVFTSSAEGKHEFGFFELTRNKLLLMNIDESSQVLAWASDTQQVITRSDTENGGALYLQRAADVPFPVFTFNQHVSEIEHPRWRTIEYRGPDDVDTFSCVLLPYNYNPQKSYPTIVDIYPGTGKACRNGSRIRVQPLGSSVPLGKNNDLLSANGYLVIQPSNNYRLNQVNGTLFGGLKSQVDAALDALIAAGMTDPARIGIWGFSNGSMASLWLASVSDRYRAIVPMFGASSPYFEYFGGASPPAFQMNLGTPLIHLVQYESSSGAMPLSMGRSAIADPFVYAKSSPLDRAKHICSPMMMVHSDLDKSFSMFHYEALFAAMYRLGRQVELVRYFGEGHGLRSPGNIRDFYGRVLAFFDKHVAEGVRATTCS